MLQTTSVIGEVHLINLINEPLLFLFKFISLMFALRIHGRKNKNCATKPLFTNFTPDVIASPNTEEFGEAIVLFPFLFSRSLLIVLFLHDITQCYKERTTLVQP